MSAVQIINTTKKYDDLAVKELGKECSAWLTTSEIS